MMRTWPERLSLGILKGMVILKLIYYSNNFKMLELYVYKRHGVLLPIYLCFNEMIILYTATIVMVFVVKVVLPLLSKNRLIAVFYITVNTFKSFLVILGNFLVMVVRMLRLMISYYWLMFTFPQRVLNIVQKIPMMSCYMIYMKLSLNCVWHVHSTNVYYLWVILTRVWELYIATHLPLHNWFLLPR